MTRSMLPVRCTTRSLPDELSDDQRAQLRQLLLEQQAFRVEQLAALHAPHVALGRVNEEINQSLETGARTALHEVQLALHRMATDTYGRCVACDATLAVEQLEIVPQLAYCMPCQRAAAAAQPLRHGPTR